VVEIMSELSPSDGIRSKLLVFRSQVDKAAVVNFISQKKGVFADQILVEIVSCKKTISPFALVEEGAVIPINSQFAVAVLDPQTVIRQQSLSLVRGPNSPAEVSQLPAEVQSTVKIQLPSEVLFSPVVEVDLEVLSSLEFSVERPSPGKGEPELGLI
jgi:hypothetical protein